MSMPIDYFSNSQFDCYFLVLTYIHLGKLSYFTNLNSSAIKGDDFPIKTMIPNGLGRTVIFSHGILNHQKLFETMGIPSEKNYPGVVQLVDGEGKTYHLVMTVTVCDIEAMAQSK